MTDGIYTLANDAVLDQLIAFLNSVEANAGDYPVAVFAYDDQITQVAAEIDRRPNVTLLADPELFAPWEEFSRQVWETHPTALQKWRAKGIKGVRRLGSNHRYAAFDGAAPFERFIYFDADVVVLNSVEFIFNQLDHHDAVIYDFQFKDPSHILNVDSPYFQTLFTPEQLGTQIFCAGFFASHRGQLPVSERQWLVEQLATGEADILYPDAPNQSLLNYMMLRSHKSIYNFAIHLPQSESTGCAVTSTHFEERERLVFDQGKRLTFLHYIGVGAGIFKRLTEGENLDCPYRETFLAYRFLHHPDQRPQFRGKPQPLHRPPSLFKRISNKLGLKL
ncbi:MAG: sugar transferase [Spirulina sp. DLM2.Bin59]|nr:MAG: sugar transferase [Spirulina sp. DLM2.Bin59]